VRNLSSDTKIIPISTFFIASLTDLKFVGKFRGIRFLFSWLCIYMKTAKFVCDTSKILWLYIMPIKAKVKQSLYRPRVAQRVPGS
jgi:hypothetical protein